MPFLVARGAEGQVLGYALVQPWATKTAYRFTVENSIYLGPGALGKGLGRALLEALLARAKQAGIREVVAVISDKGAEASVALHEGRLRRGRPHGPGRVQVRPLARHDLAAEVAQVAWSDAATRLQA